MEIFKLAQTRTLMTFFILVFSFAHMSEQIFAEQTINIYQDKSLAEKVMPKRAPDVPVYPMITADREDKLIGAYWKVLQNLRSKGWQIDRVQLEALDQNGDHRTIPSPARRQEGPEKWVFEEIPRIAGTDKAQRDIA